MTLDAIIVPRELVLLCANDTSKPKDAECNKRTCQFLSHVLRFAITSVCSFMCSFGAAQAS